jgi:transposase
MTEQITELKQRLVVEPQAGWAMLLRPQAKRELIEGCLQPGVSVAKLALMHGINANLLRKWIDQTFGSIVCC